MLRKNRKLSKRNLKPFQREYVKDVGSVFTLSTSLLMIVLFLMFCFIVYKIIEAIRM